MTPGGYWRTALVDRLVETGLVRCGIRPLSDEAVREWRRRVAAYVGWLKRKGMAPRLADRVYWVLREEPSQYGS